MFSTEPAAGPGKGAVASGASVLPTDRTRRVHPRLVALRRVTLTLAVMSSTVAAANLVGWAFDLRWLLHIPAGGQAMSPWTALSTIGLSVAIWSVTAHRFVVLRSLVCAAVAVMATAMAFEHMLGRSLGLDTWLFHNTVIHENAATPGRLAPNSVVALLLIVIAVSTARLRGRLAPAISATAALTASIIAMVALLGYATGTSHLYQVGSLTRMALPTATDLFLLGAAAALAGAERGPLELLLHDGPGGRTVRWVLPVIGLLPPLAASLAAAGREVGLYQREALPIMTLGGLVLMTVPLVLAGARHLDSGYAQRQLEAMERNRLATIVDSSTDAIMSVDRDLRVATWNHGAEAMFGWTAEEILGQNVRVLAIPGSEGQIEATLATVFAGANVRGVQTQRRAKDGRAVDVWLGVSPLRDPAGEVFGAAAILRDNTAQRRADARFRDLVEAAPDAFVLVDEQGLIRLVNEQTERLLGYAREELLGSPVEVLLPDTVRRQHVGHRAHYMDRPHARAMGEGLELNARHRDGTLIPVEISLAPLTSGDEPLIAAAIRDVRQRRATDAARRIADRRFRRTFEDSPLGMAVVDPDLRVVEANEALATLTGRTVGEIEGRPLSDLLMRDEGDLLDRAAEMFTSGGRVEKVEQRLTRLNGDPVWTSATATMVGGTDLEGFDGVDDPNGLLIFEDITERLNFEGRLRFLADHDALTGLFNRRRFEEELEHTIGLIQRYGGVGALLLLDLDNFKYINDTMGHAQGDLLLRQVSAAVLGSVRSTDIVGRLGGDEFAVLLPHATLEQAGHVAETLLQRLRQNVLMQVGERSQGASASIGVTGFGGPDDVTVSELMIQADIAMYDAKDAGRNTYRLYTRDASHRAGMLGRLTWGDRLRHALDHDDFVLLAQPILDLTGTDSRPRSELLLRLRGDNGELIPPSEFLHLADRFGLMGEIDAWVVAHSIDLLAAEAAAGRPSMFEINLSARSVGNDQIYQLVRSGLNATGVDPSGLCFEITETAAITAMETARTFAQNLRGLGCQFALDDFGAGFASFYYLKHLVFDYLKIDGEFVRGIAENPVDQLLVRSLVDVARGLGKRTIAEYVEDDVTMERLRELGVDFVQGYYVGKPSLPDEAWHANGDGSWVTSEGLSSRLLVAD